MIMKKRSLLFLLPNFAKGNSFPRLLAIFLLLASHLLFAQREDGVRIRFNGFGDVTAGSTFGKPAQASEHALFKAFGEDPAPKGTHQGVGLQGMDFVNTVFLNDYFTVQSEINLQVPRGGTGGPELDIERMYVDYKTSDKIGFQAGLIFTPVGFINRNLYSRAWLMNSVHMFRLVEEENGFVPNHFIGVTSYGVLNISDGNSLKYIVGLGNGRTKAPNENIYARSFKGYQLTGLLEWIIEGPKDLRIGMSGFFNETHTIKGVKSYGVNFFDTDSTQLMIYETGFVPYVHYAGRYFEFLAEYHGNVYHDKDFTSSETLNGLVAELAYVTKFKEKRLAPYVRYDYIQMPSYGGSYIGNRDLGGGTFTKVYEPDLNSLMLGVCYDISSFNRLKIEYATYFTGPYTQHAIVAQTAFGF
jgi:hypothetical protein